jgi:hypothetical protein
VGGGSENENEEWRKKEMIWKRVREKELQKERERERVSEIPKSEYLLETQSFQLSLKNVILSATD